METNNNSINPELESAQPQPEELQTVQPQPEEPQTECCGAHLVCERDWEAAKPEVVYYDDEELDVCANRDPDTFTLDEIALFEYVFDTMKESDVPGWVHSLQQRNIELPLVTREKVILILS